MLDKIGPEFERTSGHKLNVISGFSPNFVKQINAGEVFDVVVGPPRTIDGLIEDGKVTADADQSRALRTWRGDSHRRTQT